MEKLIINHKEIAPPAVEAKLREKYPGIFFFENVPEVASFQCRTEKGSKEIEIEIDSKDGYTFSYLLRPLLDTDFDGNKRMINGGRQVDFLIISEWTCSRQVAGEASPRVINLMGLVRPLGIVIGIPTSESYDGMNLKQLPQTPEVVRNMLYHQEAGASPLKIIVMPLMVGDLGMEVFFHELGHIYGFSDGTSIVNTLYNDPHIHNFMKEYYRGNKRPKRNTQQKKQMIGFLRAGEERLANRKGLPMYRNFIRQLGFTPEEIKQQAKFSRALSHLNQALRSYAEGAPQIPSSYFTKKQTFYSPEEHREYMIDLYPGETDDPTGAEGGT
jgi:hypothetical protein